MILNYKNYTRLEVLCMIHKQQGGTIWDFNRRYNVDFIALSHNEFLMFVKNLKGVSK